MKIQELLKKVCNIVYYIVLAAILICVVITNVSKYRSQSTGEKPTFLGYTPTIVASGSMLPELQVYGLNLVKQCDTSEVEVGNIIVYWNSQKRINIIHRVVDIEYIDGVKTLTTKGDANESEDDMKVTDENISGRVVLTMNWMAPIMQDVIVSGGGSIDYIRLLGYAIIIAVLLWAVGSSAVFILAVVGKYLYNSVFYKIKNEDVKANISEACGDSENTPSDDMEISNEI